MYGGRTIDSWAAIAFGISFAWIIIWIMVFFLPSPVAGTYDSDQMHGLGWRYSLGMTGSWTKYKTTNWGDDWEEIGGGSWQKSKDRYADTGDYYTVVTLTKSSGNPFAQKDRKYSIHFSKDLIEIFSKTRYERVPTFWFSPTGLVGFTFWVTIIAGGYLAFRVQKCSVNVFDQGGLAGMLFLFVLAFKLAMQGHETITSIVSSLPMGQINESEADVEEDQESSSNDR